MRAKRPQPHFFPLLPLLLLPDSLHEWHVPWSHMCKKKKKEMSPGGRCSSPSLFASLLSLGRRTWKPRQIKRRSDGLEGDGERGGDKKENLWDGRLSFTFLPRYPFVCLPFLKSRRYIQAGSPLTSAAASSGLKTEQGMIAFAQRYRGPSLQCKLIWKPDAHTSYFAHQNIKLITMTPAEP